MLNLKNVYNTSDDDVDIDFFIPCMHWTKKFDRGVVFFTSGWIKKNMLGVVNLAERGGKIRWIVSPILSEKDKEFFYAYEKNIDKYKEFSKLLNENYKNVLVELEADILNLLGWLIYDEIIEIRFAVPKNKLTGDFHDKFGIFINGEESIGFSGSNNDTIKGFNNYESFKVYKSWDGDLARIFINEDKKRFNSLWEEKDKNLKIYIMPQAVKEKIIIGRSNKRPYKKAIADKWKHQDEALEAFLEKSNGIISMATGTGKTRTALKIADKLIEFNEIKRIIITVSGTDLLNQWYNIVIDWFPNLTIFKSYENNRELGSFLRSEDLSVLIISRDFLLENIDRFNRNIKLNTIIICDEVHGIASELGKKKLSGKLANFKFRLGLSATPKREYDEEGNIFIDKEIGPIIYEFPLEKAIKRGVLCRLKYYPLQYNLNDREKKERVRCIKRVQFLKDNPTQGDVKQALIELANIKKGAINKIRVFVDFVRKKPDILKKSLIFVNSKNYGELLQEELIKINDNYRTYYGEDSKANLLQFSRNNIDYLITSKKISEGIDIKSVENVILFYSDRALSQTIQRIGRALRVDHDNDLKYAQVVDFYDLEIDSELEVDNSDVIRKDWLENLSKIGW